MKWVVLVSLVYLVGCSGRQQVQQRAPAAPQLVRMSTLPLLPAEVLPGQLKLEVYFYVLRDGSVQEVHLAKSSGHPEWDSSAADSLMLWRFEPLAETVQTAGAWVHYTVRVEVREPILMNLGEITAATRSEADSIYNLLMGGADFNTIIHTHRAGTAVEIGREMGSVNVGQFPDHVRRELERLRVNGVTRPIQVGSRFLIFKRFKDQNPEVARNAH